MTRTIAALMIGASLITGAGAGAATMRAQAQDAEARAIEQAMVNSRMAYARCGAVTVIVIGANTYGANKAQDMASGACVADNPSWLPNMGDGQAPGYLVEAR